MPKAAAFQEVVLSTTKTTELVSDNVRTGRLRKLGPMLYTSNMIDPPESIVRRNVWQIVAAYCPGAVVTDRTGIECRPAEDGSVFVVAERASDVKLPGLTIRPRKGRPAMDSDRLFMGGLRFASEGRLFLENMIPSRARKGISRTLSKIEMEGHLDKLQARDPEALNRIRDEARALAPVLGLEAEFTQLQKMIGGLLGSRPDAEPRAPAAVARAAGRAYDAGRLEIFESLRAELSSMPPAIRRTPDLTPEGFDNLAFFESYFSNFIEGTEFEVEEAADIVFKNIIPAARPADAHDVLGTFRVASNRQEMAVVPRTVEEFVALLKRRHRVVMELRPDKKPGRFKEIPNRVGPRQFVLPDLVEGTLARGFELYRSLAGAFERATFMMYLVAETHPFDDGNGRIARLMMNAEFAAVGEQRILIPIVYRNNYLSALRALSNDKHATPLVRVFDFAQRYARMIPWDSFARARFVMEGTHAFVKPDQADEDGVVLRIPSPELLQEAVDRDPAQEPG
jgi:hypothetical protein